MRLLHVQCSVSTNLVGVSLSEPHTSGTALHVCVCMLLACLTTGCQQAVQMSSITVRSLQEKAMAPINTNDSAHDFSVKLVHAQLCNPLTVAVLVVGICDTQLSLIHKYLLVRPMPNLFCACSGSPLQCPTFSSKQELCRLFINKTCCAVTLVCK